MLRVFFFCFIKRETRVAVQVSTFMIFCVLHKVGFAISTSKACQLVISDCMLEMNFHPDVLFYPCQDVR